MTNSRRFVWWFAAASALVWVALFGRFLIGESCFGYRDTAHLYYPLFDWAQEQWGRGEVPLWNPLDDFGGPLLADGISSVFYPLKAIFLLTWIPYPVRFAIFVSVHFLIAAWGANGLARSLKTSLAGCWLAASSYAMAGAVLFQVNNVVYFVGAAWLPWALATGWSALRDGKFSQMAWCGVYIGLMISGGDPQTAYHVLLILLVSTVAGGRRDWTNAASPIWPKRLTRLAIISLLAAGFSAIQWLPSWQWQQRSLRASSEKPFTVWDSIARRIDGKDFAVEGWFLAPHTDSHRDHIYQFSQPPWSLVELVWPNVSGKEFPTFRRWTAALPAADRVWTPSLYLGLTTLLLALCGTRLWGRRDTVGLSWMTLVFVLGSFGWYGFGWLARELDAVFHWNQFQEVPGPIGGVYWWMATFLPGYPNFRYPAKLFIVASLGLGLLAGRELTSLNRFRAKRLGWGLKGIGAVSGGLLGLSFFLPVRDWLGQVGGDAMFGPFDVDGGLRDLRVAFAHALIVSVTISISLIVFALRGRKTQAACWIVAITLVDLLIANTWLMVSVPAKVLTASQATVVPQAHGNEANIARIRRFFLDSVQPKSWREASSANRLSEVISFQRRSLFPKFHLSQGTALLGSFRSIEPLDLKWFSDAADTAFDATLGVEYRISGSTQRSPAGEASAASDETCVVTKSNSQPRAAFVPTWSPDAALQKSRLTFADRPRFESSVRQDLNLLKTAEGRAVEIRDDSINQVTVRLTSDRAGWLILKDYWDEGWIARVKDLSTESTSRQAPKRFAGVFRAVEIPRAGDFEVKFAYRPTTFYWGIAASAATIVLVIVFATKTRTSAKPMKPI